MEIQRSQYWVINIQIWWMLMPFAGSAAWLGTVCLCFPGSFRLIPRVLNLNPWQFSGKQFSSRNFQSIN